MPEKLFIVNMESVYYDIGSLLIGIATSYDNAIEMAKEAAKEFDSCSFRISSCLPNTIEMGDTCYQFEDGERKEFKLEYGLWHEDIELYPEDFEIEEMEQ